LSKSDSVLQQWLAQEQAIQAAQPADGHYAMTAADFANAPGIDHLQALVDGRCAPPPIGQTMDFLLVEVEPGYFFYNG